MSAQNDKRPCWAIRWSAMPPPKPEPSQPALGVRRATGRWRVNKDAIVVAATLEDALQAVREQSEAAGDEELAFHSAQRQGEHAIIVAREAGA